MVLITLRLSEPLDLIEVYFTFDTVSFYLFEVFFNRFATPSIEDRRTVRGWVCATKIMERWRLREGNNTQ